MDRPSRQAALFDRYAAELAELIGTDDGQPDASVTTAARAALPGSYRAAPAAVATLASLMESVTRAAAPTFQRRPQRRFGGRLLRACRGDPRGRGPGPGRGHGGLLPRGRASSAASTRPRCCWHRCWSRAARSTSSSRCPTATPSRPRRSSCASRRATAPSACTRPPSWACWRSRPAGPRRPASASQAASPQPVISFGARHVHPHITDALDYAAIVGGCVGASTPAGARLAGLAPTGTMPHSLVLVIGDTVRAAEAFDRHVAADVPRIVLVDTFKDEAEESLRVAHALGRPALRGATGHPVRARPGHG